MPMPEFKILTDDDRRQVVDTRRLALESEKWQHVVNRVGATDKSTFDERIAQIDEALEELDRLDAAINE